MEVMPGYKQTEVGVIPEDWEVIDLASLCSLQRGFDITEATKVAGDIPVYSSSGIAYFHNKALVSPPGVVTGRKGILGKVFFIEEPFWPHDTTLWVKDFKGNHPAYVALVLKNFHLERLDAATSVPTLNRNNLVGHPVPHPPNRAEQEAIAEFLSKEDALIETLERLIDKKRLLKKGVMQQLLTGKKRLSGFSGEWEVKRLDTVADIDPDNLGSGTHPDYAFKYISLEHVDVGSLQSYSEQIFSSAPSRARRRLKAGDILVSTVRPNLQSHLLFVSMEPNWVCSTGFSVVRCKSQVADPRYVFQNLFGHRVAKQIEALLTGSNYPAINGRDVKALEIPMPKLPEQTAIASILSAMDAEIALLEAQLAKYRQLKQGLMQNLLTGRVRLAGITAPQSPEMA